MGEIGPQDELTSQERRILELIGEGLTNRQIGDRIFLAEQTVKNYVSALLVCRPCWRSSAWNAVPRPPPTRPACSAGSTARRKIKGTPHPDRPGLSTLACVSGELPCSAHGHRWAR
jgi:hypothetical protein